MEEKSLAELIGDQKILFTAQDEKEVKAHILSYLSSHPVYGQYLKSLCHTDKTFDNSLGSISQYLEAAAKMKSEDNFKPCLIYDKERDVLTNAFVPTSRFQKIQKLVERVVFSDYKPLYLINDGFDMFANSDKYLRNAANSPFSKALSKIVNRLLIKKDEKGFLIQSSGELSAKALRFGLCCATASNISSAYIAGVSLAEDGNWRRYGDDEDLTSAWNRAFSAQCLFIEGLENLPRGRDALNNCLIPLLKRRNKKGLKTFAGTSLRLDDLLHKLEFGRMDSALLEVSLEGAMDLSFPYFTDISF